MSCLNRSTPPVISARNMPDIETQKGQDVRQIGRLTSIAVKIIEGLGLILANIFTLGIINIVPDIHSEYARVFGGSKVSVLDVQLTANRGIPEVRSSERSRIAPGRKFQNIIPDTPTQVVQADTVRSRIAPGTEFQNIRPDTPARIFEAKTVEPEEGPTYTEIVQKGISLIRDQTVAGATVAYQAMNQENAQTVLDVTKYLVGNLAEASWSKAKKQYTLATSPENLRLTAVSVSSLAACVIGAVTYSYLGY